MKRRLTLCILLIAVLGIFQSVYAADDIASGSINGTAWRITSEGELIIGSEGTSQYLKPGADSYFPWKTYSEEIKTARFSGNVIGKDLSNLFLQCENLTSIDLTNLDTSQTTNMKYMFYGCASLTDLDVTGFDTSNVTDMGAMFGDCKSLTSLDVTGFDTTNVTQMGVMFSDCRSLTSLDLTGFYTGKVTNMMGMFNNCSSLKSLDLSGFDMSKVVGDSSTYIMLYDCTALKYLRVPRLLVKDTSIPFTMYDMEGSEYTQLPLNLTSSITLYAEKHDHQWQETAVRPATCTADGSRAYSCSVCEETKNEVIPKTGHSWNAGTVIRPAKYYSTGIKKISCTRCGASYSQAIPVLNVAKVKPATPKIKSARISGKKLTLKWKRIAKNTVGYQVAIKDKKTGKQKIYNVKQSKKKTLSKTIKKLKKKRTYAVRIRAYNKIGDEKIYSPWSRVKQGKIR